MYLILEYLEGGTLFEHIQDNKLKTNEIVTVFIDVVKAINYLHSLNYVHRDIKPENCICGTDGHFKVCDFGFSAKFDKQIKRVTYCGTMDYLPPEIINN